MTEKTTRTIDELTLNTELDEISPSMPDEDFRTLKYEISQNGIEVQVAIAVIDDKETVVDGYNRLRALVQLQSEGKVSKAYDIPILMLHRIYQLIDAKTHAFMLNVNRRHLTLYQKISYALKVFDGLKTQKEIADLFLLKTVDPIKKVSSLNGKIEDLKVRKLHLPENIVLSIKGLQNGTVSDYTSTLKELTDAETVQTAISAIDNDQIRAKMDAMFFDTKYTQPSKKVLEQLAVEVDKVTNPSLYETKNQEVDDFLKDAKAFYEKSKKFRDKYPDQVATFTIATEAKANDTLTWCKAHVSDLEKGLWFVAVFEVPDFDKAT